MGALPKINPKKDLNKKTSIDNEMLQIAKEQEADQHLVSVRIDAQTIKLVDVSKCTGEKIKCLKTQENE